jgi:hypothetical protein
MRKDVRLFRNVGCGSIAGGILFAAFMLIGTLLLGHVRPRWMEFDYTFPSFLIGLALGAGAGIIVDRIRSFPKE